MEIFGIYLVSNRLSQTGAWGCFDEFNRITVEVLSVIAVQVKSIQDAITDKKQSFDFMGVEIPMNPTVGYFITKFLALKMYFSAIEYHKTNNCISSNPLE